MALMRQPDIFEKSIFTVKYLYGSLQEITVLEMARTCRRCGTEPAATVTETIDPNRPSDSEKWGDDETWEVTCYMKHDFTHLFGPLCLNCIRQLWIGNNEGGDEK